MLKICAEALKRDRHRTKPIFGDEQGCRRATTFWGGRGLCLPCPPPPPRMKTQGQAEMLVRPPARRDLGLGVRKKVSRGGQLMLACPPLGSRTRFGEGCSALGGAPARAPGTPNTPHRTSFGTLMGGTHALSSESGVLCNFSCGNPKISRCSPSRETPWTLTLCPQICPFDPDPVP